MSKSNRSPGNVPTAATNMNVALAVARQRLGDVHFQFALELIRRGQGEVAAPQALIIYGRLHYLTEIDVQTLRNRVLVYLGQVSNTEVTQLPNTFVAIDGGVEWDVTASMVERIRRRLNGRRNYDFREWVELHTGYAQSKILRIHVDNLVNLRESNADTRAAELTRLYMRELNVRDGLFDALYYGLLERMYESLGEEEFVFEEEPGQPDPSAETEASGDATTFGRLKKA